MGEIVHRNFYLFSHIIIAILAYSIYFRLIINKEFIVIFQMLFIIYRQPQKFLRE
jgi:hypothetical protein